MRVWVSDLDSLRWYKSSDYATAEELVRRLRRQDEVGPAAFAGRAFHSILEHARDGQVEEFCEASSDGMDFTFRFDLDAQIILPAESEIRFERKLVIDSVPVTIVGRADGREGGALWEYKLTERAPIERYNDSFQWRTYLWLADADVMNYLVFRGKANKEKTDWTIGAVDRFKQYRYPRMERDCVMAIQELIAFARIQCPDVLEAE